MQRDRLLLDVQGVVRRTRGLARRQAERYCAQLEPAELEAIHRAAAEPDHGPVIGKICDSVADRLEEAAEAAKKAEAAAKQKETEQ